MTTLPDEDGADRAVEKALSRIARRECTAGQIDELLERAGFSQPVRTEAAARLSDMGYLDDLRFARAFAEDKRALSGWGDQRIRKKLAELGVARETIDETLGNETAEEQISRAMSLLDSRFKAGVEGNREWNRAMGFLCRRGFDPDHAADAIRRHRSESMH